MTSLTELGWPEEELGNALCALAWKSKLCKALPARVKPPVSANPEHMRQWVDSLSSTLQCEAIEIKTTDSALHDSIKFLHPTLLRLNDPEQNTVFLPLISSSTRYASVLDQNLNVHKVCSKQLVELIRAGSEHSIRTREACEKLNAVFDVAIASSKKRKLAKVIVHEDFSSKSPVEIGWHLRPSRDKNIVDFFNRSQVKQRLVQLALTHTVEYTILCASWWVIGLAALRGHLEPVWLIGWMLLILSTVPFRLLSAWLSGSVAIEGAAVVKQKLLASALSLAPEEMRKLGSGRILARIAEAEELESLALGGGVMTLLAGIELILAFGILLFGAGGLLSSTVLAIWIVLIVGLARKLYSMQLSWSDERLDLTHKIVEKMIGHRTRRLQCSPEDTHKNEDEEVETYLRRSQTLDLVTASMRPIASRGWLLLGLISIAPAFVNGTSAEKVAVSIGGILLAWRALRAATGGFLNLVGAATAWKQTEVLREETEQTPQGQHADFRPVPPAHLPALDKPDTTILQAHQLCFRYPGQSAASLKSCELQIKNGDRILLEGPSGSGKSTLSSILCGIRPPESGVLLLGGLDLSTLGPTAWRRHVTAVPQFGDNYIFSGTLAFNLLMGRRWPPEKSDIELAYDVCKELGLSEVLEKMPGGLDQVVGETGWQLSHGERSRVFIARALLSESQLLVLDESFAALDPKTLKQVSDCVLSRAPALLLIAHP